MRQAICPKCNAPVFIVFDEGVQCAGCLERFDFDFLDEGKTICETKAEDIVMLVNERK